MRNALTIVEAYTCTVVALVLAGGQKEWFLGVGLLGQAALIYMSVRIYQSKRIWGSFYLYALVCVLFIMSFSCIDTYFYLEDPESYNGIHKDHWRSFVDLVYLNTSTISTIGYGDVVPRTTTTRAFACYKMSVVVFMIVFLVSDIVIKK